MADPVEFVVKKLPYDLSSHGGLALVGRLFKRINLPAMIDPAYPVQTERGGIANSDILKCYLGLHTLGKNDFEAVEGLRSQRFVTRRWACVPCHRAPRCASALTPWAPSEPSLGNPQGPQMAGNVALDDYLSVCRDECILTFQ